MQYMSPEAIEGEVVDNRSDIYSLGCSAFHLLTGQPPFTGSTIAATMAAHLTKPVPSISTVNEHLPAKTDAILERVLAKNPDDRYQSCAEFVTALREAVGVGEVPYPASAPTLAAATSPKRGAVDPDAPKQLRRDEANAAPPQRKSRAVPILASAVGVLAGAAAVFGVYTNRGGSGDTATTNTSTSLSSMTASSLPPVPPPPVVTTTAAISTPVPPQTRTVVPTTVAAAADYDYTGYINALENAGLMVPVEAGGLDTDSSAIWTGMSVCRSLGQGESPDAIIYSLANGEGMLIDNAGASAIYNAATTYLC